MPDISLSQTETYEWVGSFWFPADTTAHKEYSGKVSYSPVDGIRLSLSKRADHDEMKDLLNGKPIVKKIMHGFVRYKKESFYLTLINIYLNLGVTLSNVVSVRANGSAQGLVIDAQLDSDEINSLSVEYNAFFESALIRSQFREADILAFAKADGIKLDNGVEICTRDYSTSRIIHGADDFCELVSSFNDEATTSIQSALSQALADKKECFFLKDKIDFIIQFKKANSSLSLLHKIEEMWSDFWSLVIDRSIRVKRSWINVSYNNGEGTKTCAFLASRWKHESETDEPRHTWHLKLNFYKFGGDKQSLAGMSDVLNKWFFISENPNWEPVVRSIQRALNAKNHPIDSPVYVALIAEIQTFLDLIGKTPQNADVLINLLATEKWKSALSEIIGELPTNSTLGSAVSNIRNAIVHPISLEKKDRGKWKKLSMDYISLLKIYAILSGLLVKGMWMQLAQFKDGDLDAYVDDFITRRTFTHISYNE